jgi:hypothetical protein
MIINEAHRFVFVHIPKCAGSSIRKMFTGYNQWTQIGPRKIRETPTHGTIDHAHIPLFMLRELYPDNFEQVCSFESFALVRNPFDRFFSSVQQKMRMDLLRNNQATRLFSDTEITSEIENVVAYLSTLPDSPHQLPHNYIHFQRQVDYIFLNDVRIVKHVFCLRNLDQFFNTIKEKTGIVRPVLTDSDKERNSNQSRSYRNNLSKMIDTAFKPIRDNLSKVTPYSIRKLYRLATKAPTSNAYTRYLNPSVRKFIESYYKKDIELFDSLCVDGTSAHS